MRPLHRRSLNRRLTLPSKHSSVDHYRQPSKQKSHLSTDSGNRVQELENKLEAGLLEEVILVAEGELKLVKTMLESRM